MERYMQNRQHARQLEQEQRAREQKAFILEPKKRLEPCTIPQPFALQTELREARTQPIHPSSLSDPQLAQSSLTTCFFGKPRLLQKIPEWPVCKLDLSNPLCLY